MFCGPLKDSREEALDRPSKHVGALLIRNAAPLGDCCTATTLQGDVITVSTYQTFFSSYGTVGDCA